MVRGGRLGRGAVQAGGGGHFTVIEAEFERVAFGYRGCGAEEFAVGAGDKREAAREDAFVGDAVEDAGLLAQGICRAGEAAGDGWLQAGREALEFGLAGGDLLARVQRDAGRRRSGRSGRACARACGTVSPEALGHEVETLAGAGEQCVGPGQAAARGAEFELALLQRAEKAARETAAHDLDLRDQFGADGQRHFGSAGGRRRAAVGGVVDQRGVGFVADGGDQRDDALGGGADDALFVEGPKVFDGAAAARDDDDIRTRAWDRRACRR